MLNLTTSDYTDEEIVLLIQRGSKELFIYIIRRYEKKLSRYANYLIGDHNLADDAVQETFIKSYINLQSFDTKLKFSSWIYRILHNQAINLIKKHKREKFVELKYDVVDNLDIEQEVIDEEIKEHVKARLGELPILYAEPLLLFFLEMKTYNEISDILRIPVNTVGTRISRGKALMKKLCQKEIY